MHLLSLACVFLVIVTAAGCFHAWLRRCGPGVWWPAAAASVVMLSAPLFVPSSQPLIRLAATLAAVTAWVKVFDLAHDTQRATRFGTVAFLLHLANPFCLVARAAPARVETRAKVLVVQLLGRAAASGALLFVLIHCWPLNWKTVGLPVEHLAKTLGVIAAVWVVAATGGVAWRLLGAPVREPMGNLLTASSPAAFWRHWNRPAGQTLYRNVFLPWGGRHHPRRAVLAVFLFNGLLHEYVFGVPAGRASGLMLLFFAIQGVAVALTWRFRLRGGKAWIGAILTMLFNLATAVLFFAGVHAVVPVYANALPEWLGHP